jgi:Domain of unknown function (DUF6398)
MARSFSDCTSRAANAGRRSGIRHADGILCAVFHNPKHRIVRLFLYANEYRSVRAMRTPLRATNVPKPMLPAYESIISLTDAVCGEHLDSEYKTLSRAMAAALCRKRQSPLGSGQPKSWACSIVYVLGRVNFLDDPSFSPHMKTSELAKAFGVSEATIHAKARFIEKALGVNMLDPRWTAPSRIEHNPLTWMAKVGGFIVDLRAMPRDVQEQAFDAGLIPFIPADQKA